MVVVNTKSQTNMLYSPTSLVLVVLVNLQGSLHCKQDSLREHPFATWQYGKLYKGEVENIVYTCVKTRTRLTFITANILKSYRVFLTWIK